MNVQEIVTKLQKSLGGKSKQSIGDTRETVAKLSEILYKEPDALVALLGNGGRRVKAAKAKVAKEREAKAKAKQAAKAQGSKLEAA